MEEDKAGQERNREKDKGEGMEQEKENNIGNGRKTRGRVEEKD